MLLGNGHADMLLSRVVNFICMSMKWNVIYTKPLQAQYQGSPPSAPRTLESPINVHQALKPIIGNTRNIVEKNTAAQNVCE